MKDGELAGDVAAVETESNAGPRSVTRRIARAHPRRDRGALHRLGLISGAIVHRSFTRPSLAPRRDCDNRATT